MPNKKIKNETIPYQRIHDAVGTIIKKNGPEQAADLLESLSITTKIKDKTHIREFIMAQVKTEHGINLKTFQTSNAQAYKDARKSAFLLLNMYADLSAQKIKQYFKSFPHSRQQINNCIAEMKDVLQVPAANRKLYNIHIRIDENVKIYIDK